MVTNANIVVKVTIRVSKVATTVTNAKQVVVKVTSRVSKVKVTNAKIIVVKVTSLQDSSTARRVRGGGQQTMIDQRDRGDQIIGDGSGRR